MATQSLPIHDSLVAQLRAAHEDFRTQRGKNKKARFPVRIHQLAGEAFVAGLALEEIAAIVETTPHRVKGWLSEKKLRQWGTKRSHLPTARQSQLAIELPNGIKVMFAL